MACRKSYLCVAEEEDSWYVLEPSLHHNLLKVVSPLHHSVVLGKLYLEQVVFNSTTEEEEEERLFGKINVH